MIRRKEEMGELIASYMEVEGTMNTESGVYIFYFEELNRLFGVNLPADKELMDEIESSLNYDKILDLVIDDECFDLNFGLAYCLYAEFFEDELEEAFDPVKYPADISWRK